MRNCPVCGAENEQEARFCAECGAPLDVEDTEATMVGRVMVVPGPEEEEDDSERTVVSSFFREVEEAETMTIDQAQVAAMASEAASEEPVLFPPAEAEAEPPPVSAPLPPPPPVSETPAQEMPPRSTGVGEEVPRFGTGEAGPRKRNTPLIIGIVVAILLLCCCCCSLIVGSSLASDPDTLEDILRELSVSVSYFLV